jgi:hypothetical protein
VDVIWAADESGLTDWPAAVNPEAIVPDDAPVSVFFPATAPKLMTNPPTHRTMHGSNPFLIFISNDSFYSPSIHYRTEPVWFGYLKNRQLSRYSADTWIRNVPDTGMLKNRPPLKVFATAKFYKGATWLF